jgi:hypothetical protein
MKGDERMKRTVLLSAAFAFLFCGAETAKAGFLPVGVQNDVQLSTVTGAWGWSIIYQDSYSVDSVAISTAFAGAGDYLMLGAIRHGSSTIEVLAAALTSDVMTHTAQHVTHTANGAEWYFNGGSLGFAGLGDTIFQTQADVNGFNERDRLSWHTNGPAGFIGEYSAAPTHIRFGWRAGTFTGLNGSTEWDKIIFTMNAEANPVPAPAGLMLVATALPFAGFLGLRRRKKTAAA